MEFVNNFSKKMSLRNQRSSKIRTLRGNHRQTDNQQSALGTDGRSSSEVLLLFSGAFPSKIVPTTCSPPPLSIPSSGTSFWWMVNELDNIQTNEGTDIKALIFFFKIR